MPVTPFCPFASDAGMTDTQLAIAVSVSQTELSLCFRLRPARLQSRPPTLNFLRAQDPRGTSADALLEMVKTATLGSVSGNL